MTLYENADAALREIARVDFIAVDTETTGLAIKDGRDFLLGISVAWGPTDEQSMYFPFRHEQSENLDKGYAVKLNNLFQSRKVVFHNAKFDLFSLATIGIDPPPDFYDTLTIAHMVNEEWNSKALDALCAMFFNEHKDKSKLDNWVKLFGWASVPAIFVEEYARKDAWLTYRLFFELSKSFESQELQGLWHYERDFISLLCKMEGRGVRLNSSLCSVLSARGTDRMGTISDELGFRPSESTHLGKYFFDELKLPVLYRTPTGKPAFHKAAMIEYEEILANSKSLNEAQKHSASLVLEFRGWQKAVSSSYDGWLNLVSPDGRLRPNYKLHGTRTGRLSCEAPNLQQIPRSGKQAWNSEITDCFTAREGYSLLQFDYSQLEYRLACVAGREQHIIADFNNGMDPFRRTAVEVFGEFTSDNRQKSKTLTYTVLYGGGVNRVRNVFGFSESESKATLERFYSIHSGIKIASRRATALAESQGFIRYWTGRRRHFPDSRHAYKAFNSAIQGGAAEIVKRAMLRLSSEVDCDDAAMLLQVHDAVYIEARNDLVEQITKDVSRIMSDWPDLPVRLPVDMKVVSK